MPGRGLPEGHAERAAILHSLFEGEKSSQETAEQLASMAVGDDTLESGLSFTWASIMITAYNFPDQLDVIASLLVSMASLPPVTDENGGPISIYGERVWSDLPRLGMDFNYEWNALEIPQDGPQRRETIMQFWNVNKLAAKLMQSHAAAFEDYDWFSLCTMRAALEETADSAVTSPPDAFIPAAAMSVSISGSEIYQLDKDFPSGPLIGDRGAGGPLWSGRHGFCKERWCFWRERFAELSLSNELSGELKDVAASAALEMSRIEASSD